jgi:predicted 2-oxoglutarate/Fe(II)-dependent dioxygenase YbiX
VLNHPAQVLKTDQEENRDRHPLPAKRQHRQKVVRKTLVAMRPCTGFLADRLCDFLAQFYDKLGGKDSGFLLDNDGKTATVVDHRLKRRTDLGIAHPEVREAIRGQIVRRLIPAIERFFQFSATRMDRYIVACYDSAVGGHFHRHRDNVNAGAQHRRFAVTINLNKDYDGCDLVFPEFGRRTYRAPHGGTIVFSCGALHQVTPVTRGRRYAFLAFLYGEADAVLREKNNAKIVQSEFRYSAMSDLLFPDDARTSERRAG